MRPSWTTYFMQIAHLVATRSTCLRAKHGAIIARDRQILSTGYNGAPSGVPHCQQCERIRLGCLPGQRYEECVAAHSEMNAIAQAAKHGTRIDGAMMYITGPPCKLCARLIINSGITHIVYLSTGRYRREDTGLDILLSAGVTVEGAF